MAKGVKAFKNGTRYSRNLDKFFDNKFMTKSKKQLAEFVITDIVKQTRLGHDVNDQKFPKLSKKYEQFLARKGFQPHFWLSLTGKALGTPSRPNNFKIKIAKKFILIIWSGPKYMIYHQKGTKPQPKRTWFGIKRRSTLKGIFQHLKRALSSTVKAMNSQKRL